jgi:transcriptional regulator with XRE-family HTH domain
MKNFAETIRKAREDKGFILRKVASITDIDQSIISKLEKGERKPTREQVLKLADCYELDRNSLIIDWKSDLVYYSIQDEELATEILKVAEEKVKYGTSNL